MTQKQGFILMFSLILLTPALAQKKYVIPPQVKRVGKNQEIVLQADLPLGVFQRSHLFGAGVNYGWSRQRFGNSVTIARPFGLYLGAGANYYLGKKVTTAGYPFRYDDYFYFQGVAGVIYNPFENVSALIAAGPSIGLYAKNANVGFVVNLSGSYYFNNNISIGPALLYKKHEKQDALWAIGLRGSYAF